MHFTTQVIKKLMKGLAHTDQENLKSGRTKEREYHQEAKQKDESNIEARNIRLSEGIQAR